MGDVLVSVPDPKPTPVRIAFSVTLYWKRYTRRMRSGDKTREVRTILIPFIVVSTQKLETQMFAESEENIPFVVYDEECVHNTRSLV